MDGLHDDHENGPTDLESKVLHVQGNVLQTVGGQLIQVNVGDGDAGTVLTTSQEDEESRKRRELLARRPSYRKIFNELHEGAGTVPKVEDDGDSNDSLMSGDDLPNNSFSSSAGGVQTLTMTNASTASQVSNANANAATIVQYAQGPDGQFFIPVSTISAGNISYQLAPGNAVTQGVVMASGGGGSEEASRKRELRLLKNSDPSSSPQWLSNLESSLGLPTPTRRGHGGNMDEAARKLELRLLKNREAARECRRKKKEYIKCLENRVALLENQNKTLIEELKSLKELYCQKETQS